MEAAAPPLVDVLFLTALTEEQQVVEQVLRLRASYRGPAGEPPERVNVYAYPPGAATPFHIATASIHQMGAVPMAAKAPRIFNAVRPEVAVLLGISATTAPGTIDLGDVPVASQVIEYDDIAAASGEFSFRPEGYQVDPRLRDAAGALRADLSKYSAWQDDCLAVITELVAQLNGARSTQIKSPSDIRRPHLLVGIGAGGPFLIRDPDFRSKVQSLHPKLTWVEMESHGFMRAAHEHHIEAIVVKGISDAGDADKEALEKATGGFYRAFACSNSTLAVLHLLDQAPWRPRAFDDRGQARAMLERASTQFASGDFESACRLAEATIKEAHRLGERELERAAHVFRIRVALQVSGDIRSQAARVRESKEQLERVRDLGASRYMLSLLTAEIALSEGDGEVALTAAEAAIASASADADRLDGVLVKLQALEILERGAEAEAFESEVSHLRDNLPESMIGELLALEVAWLRVRCAGGTVVEAETATFIEEIWRHVGKGSVHRNMAAILLTDLATGFRRWGRTEELLAVLLGAYHVLEPQGDHRRLAELALQVAQVAESARELDLALKYVGNAQSWLAKDPNSRPSQAEMFVRQLTFLRGRLLLAAAVSSSEERRAGVEQSLQVFTALLEDIDSPDSRRRGEATLLRADVASWAGRAAALLGRMREAADLFGQTRPEAALVASEFAEQVAFPAWLGQAQALLLGGEVDKAIATARTLCSHPRAPKRTRGEARDFEKRITGRVLPFLEWFRTADAAAVSEHARVAGVRAAIAEQTRPLVAVWKRWGGKEPAGYFDFWGRGGFSRVVAAINTSPHSVIAVDATSIQEIRRWARMLCPLFETVIVKWKGKLGGVVVSVACPRGFPSEGEFRFGGEGYWWTSSVLEDAQDWAFCQGWSNPIPDDLAAFLCGEGLPLIAAGRLVVLPAPLVGCSQTAVGWTDELFLRLMGGVVNVVKRVDATTAGQVLDLAEIKVPFLDGVPLDALPGVLDETEEWIPELRSRILAGRWGETPEDAWRAALLMEGELRGVFRQLTERFQRLASGRDAQGWRVQEVDGALAAARSDLLVQDAEPITTLLRSMVSEKPLSAPWIPFWRLNGVGGKLSWSSPVDNPSISPSPTMEAPDDLLYGDVQSWLCKGSSAGLRVILVRAEPVEQAT